MKYSKPKSAQAHFCSVNPDYLQTDDTYLMT